MKVLTASFFSFFTICSFGQNFTQLENPKVDERIELLSIVFRLAESTEYSSEKFKFYTDKIQAYYKPYKNHELIAFVKKLRKDNGVGYDAVMSMAIHLDYKFNPLIEFTDKIPDARWGKENAYQFVKLLNKFYKESKSEIFFKQNQSLYKEVGDNFQTVYKHLDISWYTSFYGKEPTEKFIIINALGNGDGNFGPSINLPNGKREVYAIMGTWETDSLGMAKYTLGNYFPFLLHEFNHSFINYLLEKNPDPFTKSGRRIYQSVENEMRNQAYGNWETMLNEALVRAAVIKYMKDHQFTAEEIKNETDIQLNRAFFWIEELVAELEKYDKQRNLYSTLESYMPNIIKAYDSYAKNLDFYLIEFEKRRPKIISISEFTNGSQEVSSEISTITIHFDREMRDGYSFDKGPKGENFLPEVINVEFSEDKRCIKLKVKLQPNKVYQFVATNYGFKSANGVPIKTYEINFKTK
ncbi:DUF4932 domain-containing protein [Lacibacter sp.]|uniref:DUF4932 domain-containing protein n=1 Tax=Lacibacter sp. TaxID=1915409 RepID=UPI002B4B4EB1|nr:DUF4932 domain-containing protein [Lacibacter sp.]HLP38958.1 DUF4932 domain-containing protein [Lacibacter sp.]